VKTWFQSLLFQIRQLVPLHVGAWLCVKKATAPRHQVLPLQIQYNEDGKPLALPAPMGIVPYGGGGGGEGEFRAAAEAHRAYTLAAMGMSNEPVLLPGPYDGQPTMAPKLAGLAGEGAGGKKV
jgi:hypothetical protein